MFRRASHLDTAIQPPSVKIRSRSFAVLPARKRRGHARRAPHREHLHSCGEHNPTGLAIIIKMGSSPRLQGTLVAPVAERPHGIISACAGSTCRGNSCAAAGGGHPRMRGEHAPLARLRAVVEGSSPHPRGAPVRHPRGRPEGGIIPAYAGSTSNLPPHLVTFGDHPRMRGEHLQPDLAGGKMTGSSPHARGAHVVPGVRAREDGIIPACAGSTAKRHCPPPPFREGSSPHARGARRGAVVADDAVGIIPACAGSTGCRSRCRRAGWDHPRIRGEH